MTYCASALNLVQTDVTVFDRGGHFADNLGREQFELKVDGREQPILFFERAAAGSTVEAARIRAARGSPANGTHPRPLRRAL